MTDPRPCRIFLVGMMGSGKTTIGRLLSAAWGWPYTDNDELVVRLRGRTSRELLAAEGERSMRRAESDALALAVAVPAPAIVGIASGTILDPDDRQRLSEAGIVVWLRATAEALAGRSIGAAHRPWLDADGEAWITDALDEREPLYRSVADLTIDTDAGPPEAALDALRGGLAAWPDCAALVRE